MGKLDGISLFHSFRDKDGTVIPGMSSILTQEALAFHIPKNLTGKSVLDIGAFDGYYSFLCESRGAYPVVAIDSEEHLLAYEHLGIHHSDGAVGFNTVKEMLYPDSKVDYRRMTVYDVEDLGMMFDLVLFMGVYYHTKHPLLAFEKCRSVAKGSILVEGLIHISTEPLMYFVEGSEMNNDPTNWWVPSMSCLKAMMRVAGFKNIKELVPTGRVVLTATI